ncbi:MAG: O-acetyl-ADP-ribose deacetylase [Firmicutes bacterium ADurb.Bin373]|nr:MAG: O-acetyl-ADP-ribose deacetylase [Firmicutes bacterium ADurb.Bin373]
MEAFVGKTLIKIIMGDITRQETEAIVNAANSGLLGGGGVDGAIHRAGGPQILAECKEIRARQGTLPTGRAVITGGGRLKARYVIHTVGPVWSGGKKGEDELLRSAYRSSLSLAKEKGIRSVSFPSVSTGIYSFPVDRAARIALREVRDFVSNNPGFEEVRFVLFSAPVLKEFETAWEEINSREH